MQEVALDVLRVGLVFRASVFFNVCQKHAVHHVDLLSVLMIKLIL